MAVTPAAAQDTRAEDLALRQQQRAADLAPYEPGRAERIVTRLENSVLGVAPIGFYPWFGSIYPSGWLAFGAGHRTVFSDTGSVNVTGGWSLRNFKTAQGVVALPDLAGGHVKVRALARWVDAPAVRFFGLGQASNPDDPAHYHHREASVGTRADIQPLEWLSVGAAVDYLDYTNAGTGADDSVDAAFSPIEAPGLLSDPAYVRSTVSAAVDWRQPPGYSGTGGLYRVELATYSQTNDGPHSFRQLEAEAVQLVPILRANWVIALRGMVTTTHTTEGEQVPYFLMPALGGSRNVRGFPSFRFRDRHRLLWSAEYRWTPARFVDMAIFYDAGKVTSRTRDLDLSGLDNSYGIGMRVVGLTGTVLRIEVARSRETAFSLIWTSSAAF